MQLTIFFINAKLELEWHLKIIFQRLTFLLFTVFQNGEVQKLYLLFHKIRYIQWFEYVLNMWKFSEWYLYLNTWQPYALVTDFNLYIIRHYTHIKSILWCVWDTSEIITCTFLSFIFYFFFRRCHIKRGAICCCVGIHI